MPALKSWLEHGPLRGSQLRGGGNPKTAIFEATVIRSSLSRDTAHGFKAIRGAPHCDGQNLVSDINSNIWFRDDAKGGVGQRGGNA